MKLLLDVARWLAVNIVRFFFIVAIVGFGALLVTEGCKRIEDDPVARLRAHQEELTRLEEQERVAIAALHVAEQEANEDRQRVEAERSAASSRMMIEGQQALLARSEFNAAEKALIGAENAVMSFTNEGSQAGFMRLCRETLSQNFCQNVKREADTLAGAHNTQWYRQLGGALSKVCGTFGLSGAASAAWNAGFGAGLTTLAVCNTHTEDNLKFVGLVSQISNFERREEARRSLQEAQKSFDAAKEEFERIAPNLELETRYTEALKARQDLEKRIAETKAAVGLAADDPWTRAVQGWHWFVDNIVAKYWWVAASAILLPYALAWIVYVFAVVVAPWLGKFRLRKKALAGEIVRDDAEAAEFVEPLASKDGTAPRATITVGSGNRLPRVQLSPGDRLLVRANYVSSSKGGGAKLLYSWKYPFVSYAAGLVALSDFKGESGKQILLSASGVDHHDEYIARVKLENHPGFVVRPSRVVAIRGNLKLARAWSFGLSSWARGQFGYFYFSGTGEVFLSAPGGVAPRAISGVEGQEGSEQLSHDLILGWDGRLGIGVACNENWIQSALLRNQDLFESKLVGHGVYLQGHSAKEHKVSGATRFLHGFFDLFLKIFGI